MNADWTACRQFLVGAHDRACHSTLKLPAFARDAGIVELTSLADGSRITNFCTARRERLIFRATSSLGGWHGGTTHPRRGGCPLMAPVHFTNHSHCRCSGRHPKSANNRCQLGRTY